MTISKGKIIFQHSYNCKDCKYCEELILIGKFIGKYNFNEVNYFSDFIEIHFEEENFKYYVNAIIKFGFKSSLTVIW